MKSALWSVARLTVVPPMKTGASSATGVSLPVRPTCTVMALTCVTARFGGELVGDGPARGAAGVAEALLGGVGVDFENHAVDLVAQRCAVGFGTIDEAGSFLRPKSTRACDGD